MVLSILGLVASIYVSIALMTLYLIHNGQEVVKKPYMDPELRWFKVLAVLILPIETFIYLLKFCKDVYVVKRGIKNVTKLYAELDDDLDEILELIDEKDSKKVVD